MSNEAFPASVADALAAAEAEFSGATEDELEIAEPAIEEEALPGDEQAEVTGEEEQAEEQATEELFSDELLEELEAAAEADAPLEVPDDYEVTFPGAEGPVTLRELKDGYLRQADYTQKTQEVAAQRKENEAAIEFWTAWNDDPERVLRILAAKAGMIEDEAAGRMTMEVSPFKSADEVEAEIQRRVEELVTQHPDVQQARQSQAIAAVEAEFRRIETDRGIELGPKTRETILREADRRGVADLEFVLDALLAAKERRAQQSKNVRAAAPSKPSSASATVQSDDAVMSVADALRLAERDLELQARA